MTLKEFNEKGLQAKHTMCGLDIVNEIGQSVCFVPEEEIKVGSMLEVLNLIENKLCQHRDKRK